jgi:hypothetical protein
MSSPTHSTLRTLVPVPATNPGRLTRIHTACTVCGASLDYTIADLQPYNNYELSEGYVFRCGYCRQLQRTLSSQLSEKENQALLFTFQQHTNVASANAAIWRVHGQPKQTYQHFVHKDEFVHDTNQHGSMFTSPTSPSHPCA